MIMAHDQAEAARVAGLSPVTPGMDPEERYGDHRQVKVVIMMHACAHHGRIVVFLSNGAAFDLAFERATDGSWSRYESFEGAYSRGRHAASILLG